MLVQKLSKTTEWWVALSAANGLIKKELRTCGVRGIDVEGVIYKIMDGEAMNKYENLCERIRQFNNERDWNQFHSPANLAKSISIEAGELLECFQWNDKDYDKECVIEELSDIVNYCIQMAQILGIDLIDETNKKIDVNEIKYPVNKAKGVSTKYNKL